MSKKPKRPRLSIGNAVPTDATPEERIEALHGMVTHLQSRMVEVRKSVSPEIMRQHAVAVYETESARLEKLRDDCVKVLGLLREKGIVTEKEIAEALNG